MAIRTIFVALLAFALGLTACALEPAAAGEDTTTGTQHASLTSGDVVVETGHVGTLGDPYTTAQQGPGLPGDQLRGGGDPDKPQPDPWNPGQPIVQGEAQGSIGPTANQPAQ